eukprot:scaffold6043_cov32-Tisochrysis_lutea.AAC.1
MEPRATPTPLPATRSLPSSPRALVRYLGARVAGVEGASGVLQPLAAGLRAFSELRVTRYPVTSTGGCDEWRQFGRIADCVRVAEWQCGSVAVCSVGAACNSVGGHRLRAASGRSSGARLFPPLQLPPLAAGTNTPTKVRVSSTSRMRWRTSLAKSESVLVK